MKKLISMVLALLLMLPSFTAFAAADGGVLNALFNTKYTSGELDYTITVHPNVPLPAFIDPDGSQTKMLSGMNYTYRIKYHASEDQRKMQAEMDMTAVIPMMKPMTMKYWIDMDLSDMENPVYKIITKTPDADKYMVMDYAKNPIFPLAKMGPAYQESLKGANNEWMKNIDLSKLKMDYKDGKYVVILEEKMVKDLCKSIAVEMSKYMAQFVTGFTKALGSPASSIGIIGAADGPTSVFTASSPSSENEDAAGLETIKAEYEKAVTEFFEKLEPIQLFDKDAVVLETQMDGQNKIKTLKLSVNVKTNLAELMELAGGADAAVTKENSNLNVSLVLDFAYSKINEPIDITFPQLTDENSVDLFGSIPTRPVIDTSKIDVVVDGKFVRFDAAPVMQKDKVLVPLREFVNALGISDEDVLLEDGRISITSGNTLVNLTVGSTTATVNGKAVSLDVPVTVYEGKIFVPVRFIADTFQYEVEWIQIYKEGTGGLVDLTSKRTASRVTVMVPSDAMAEDIKRLDKASMLAGINADIMTVPVEQYKEKAMIMIAAGEPAVIMRSGRLDNEVMDRLTSMQAVMPLEDLIEKHAPYVKKYLAENPEFKNKITSKDGHIYILPTGPASQTGTGEFFITTTVKNPQTVLKWLDYLYAEEGLVKKYQLER